MDSTVFDTERFFASKPVVLAPMAGVNDPAFRALCKRMGAALSYTEMISTKGLSYGNTKTDDMLMCVDDELPLAVQLFGNEPHIVAAQAQEIERRMGNKLALIDINMGCPARKVAGKGDGAALMRSPERAFEILSAVVTQVQVPVTVKFRKGYELHENTAQDFALMAEEAGVAAVAVHGRTAQQMYRGKADRSVIDCVAKALRIPVIASGDVYTQADIQDYFSRGAAAVMVARGAQGNPWIFSPAIAPPSLEARLAVAWEHTSRLYELKPDKLVSMRRHIAWYFKGLPHAAALRRSLNSCVTLQDYEKLFEELRSCP
jgi:nifR3 family TIM-barrel protein